jgi:diacylglycerol kinase family enzyme
LIAKHLKSHFGEFEHCETVRVGSAIEQVRDAIARGASLIVAVGGDGTVNEAVNGLAATEVGLPTRPLSVIMTGTGSDLARSLGWDGNFEQAVDRIVKGATRKIDLARVRFIDHAGTERARMFANIASFGVSGRIARNVSSLSRRGHVPRKSRFLLATVKALARFRPQKIRLGIDGDDVRARR